jgi:ABC-type transport system involved in cytochrome bd biosynthesis fused ATPase/permease subunit
LQKISKNCTNSSKIFPFIKKVSACKLSGGQRSRISVARALYSNREIYLFDDIFSSIDKPVAERIFAQGIKEMLATKTRLVVTCDPDVRKGKINIILFIYIFPIF